MCTLLPENINPCFIPAECLYAQVPHYGYLVYLTVLSDFLYSPLQAVILFLPDYMLNILYICVVNLKFERVRLCQTEPEDQRWEFTESISYSVSQMFRTTPEKHIFPSGTYTFL